MNDGLLLQLRNSDLPNTYLVILQKVDTLRKKHYSLVMGISIHQHNRKAQTPAFSLYEKKK